MPTPLNFPMTPLGYSTVYIPGYYGDKEAHARLMIGYALNEDMLALNQWATVVGTDQARAYYPVFNSSDFVRLKNLTGNDRRWAAAGERPVAAQGVRFSNREFQLERYGESTFVDGLTEEYSQIGSSIVLSQETLASRALTWRSVIGASVVTDPDNYFTSATPAVTDNYFTDWAEFTTAMSAAYPANWFGDGLYSGTIASPVFKRFLGHVQREIMRRTNNKVKLKDLLFLANPNTFGKLAATEEMHAYVAQQSGSGAVLRGTDPDFADPAYGLPQPTYQFKMVSDASTVTVGAPSGAADDVDYGRQSYLIPDDFISVLTRPGSVVGLRGSQGYSSVVLFQNKERALKPTTFPDMRNDRTEVAVEDMFTMEMVAPDCSFAIGSAVA